MADKKIAGAVAFGIGMIGLVLCAASGQASAADSLCAPNEEVFFNCRIKDSPKVLSVCGLAGEEARRGATLPGDYLQYRFGSHDKPELVFPKTREGSLDKFWVVHEYVRSASYESHQLSFQSGGSDYRVYAVSQMADAGPNAPPDEYGGVIVGTSSGRDINIPCASIPENKLGSLVRKFGVEYREGQTQGDGGIQASFQMCKAMPFNSSDSDFKPGVAEYELDPLNDAFSLGRHDTPEVIELENGAAERVVAKPQHGKLVRNRKTAGGHYSWSYIPAPGFVGNDYAKFIVRGKAKGGEAVEFTLIYKLRVTPEKLRAYLPQPGPPLLSVPDTYCLISTILLDYVSAP
jgi:hypothetical protein